MGNKGNLFICLQFLFILVFVSSCEKIPKERRTENFPHIISYVEDIPKKENIWVFIMAGQSNMAGRAFVEARDTISNKRILTINRENNLIYAKEPIHFYEPSLKGLDMGMSFGREVLKYIPDTISLLLIPCAVGGSSLENWMEDKEHRGVRLFSNFNKKIELGKKYGNLKAILWHQGETTKSRDIQLLDTRLCQFVKKVREAADNQYLPFIVGNLGSYSDDYDKWNQINLKINSCAATDSLISVVQSKNLSNKGDKIHFDSKSIRLLGKRYARKFLKNSMLDITQ